ncbi:MAG: LAGLIDADG family homing endonuclease [Candidatus Thorarchaeota archaeon]
MELVRDEIKSLIKNNVSIPQISKQLNVAKSTVYYHYKSIKGRKYSIPTIPEKDAVLGEFLGIFAGDGSLILSKDYHYRISIYLHANDDREYANYIKELIQNNFNKKVREYINENSLHLTFYSVDIYYLIKKYVNLYPHKTYNIYIKNPEKLSNKFLSYFIRGLFDTDGHHKKDGRLVLCLASKKMIYQMSEILKTRFKILSSVYKRNVKSPWKDQYELYIPKREVAKYRKEIGFSNKRKERNKYASAGI